MGSGLEEEGGLRGSGKHGARAREKGRKWTGRQGVLNALLSCMQRKFPARFREIHDHGRERANNPSLWIWFGSRGWGKGEGRRERTGMAAGIAVHAPTVLFDDVPPATSPPICISELLPSRPVSASF